MERWGNQGAGVTGPEAGREPKCPQGSASARSGPGGRRVVTVGARCWSSAAALTAERGPGQADSPGRSDNRLAWPRSLLSQRHPEGRPEEAASPIEGAGVGVGVGVCL